MRTRVYNYCIFFIGIFVVCGMFNVKHKFNILNYQIQEINHQSNIEKERIHTLRAEMTYLTSSDKFKKIAYSKLGLRNVSTAQMVKDPLYDNDLQQIPIRNDVVKNSNVKWRYKKIADQYLHTVSNYK